MCDEPKNLYERSVYTVHCTIIVSVSHEFEISFCLIVLVCTKAEELKIQERRIFIICCEILFWKGSAECDIPGERT